MKLFLFKIIPFMFYILSAKWSHYFRWEAYVFKASVLSRYKANMKFASFGHFWRSYQHESPYSLFVSLNSPKTFKKEHYFEIDAKYRYCIMLCSDLDLYGVLGNDLIDLYEARRFIETQLGFDRNDFVSFIVEGHIGRTNVHNEDFMVGKQSKTYNAIVLGFKKKEHLIQFKLAKPAVF